MGRIIVILATFPAYVSKSVIFIFTVFDCAANPSVRES